MDLNFGTSGKIITDLGNSDNGASSVAIQSDGKIAVAGESNDDFAIVRYNSDGSIDNTFGNAGKVTTNFVNEDVCYSIAIQSDGKIVLTGVCDYGNSTSFATARYNSDGSLDNSFGTTGKVINVVGGPISNIYSLAIQGDGKIVLGGYQYMSGTHFVLLRYNIDGSFDNSFGSGGIVSTNFSGGDEINSLAIQSDGKMVVAGESNNDFAIVRYNSNGSIDNSFGNGGITTTDFGGGLDIGYSIALQNDGKIVIAGVADYLGGDSDFAIARYNQDGMGIDENIYKENIISISPNPFTNIISVTGMQENGELILFDINGKEILKQKCSVKEIQITTSDLLSGAYLLKYNDQNVTENHKLLKY